MIKSKIVKDIIRKLDGAAVANVKEPSPGDLERVLKANSQLREKRAQILDYCQKHMWKGEMWSAVIVGILLDCDFKDAHVQLEKKWPK